MTCNSFFVSMLRLDWVKCSEKRGLLGWEKQQLKKAFDEIVEVDAAVAALTYLLLRLGEA